MAGHTSAPQPQAAVYIVDDNPDVRNDLEALMGSVGLETHVFSRAEAFLAAYGSARPMCVIADIRMPGMGGLELQQQLISRGVRSPLIMLSRHNDATAAAQVMRAGAFDFLLKPYSRELLLSRVHEALAHDAQRAREESRHLQAVQRVEALSDGERAVLDLVMQGLGNKQIAFRLGLTIKAIEARRARIRQKLAVDNIVDMVCLVLTATTRSTAA